MNTDDIKNPAKRVALYIRVSTDDQLDGYGAQTQRDAIMSLIKAKEHVPEPFIFAGEEHVYFDESISGRTPLEERPQFARLKEAVLFSSKENRPFDVVAVYRIDRFARKLYILLDIIRFFEDTDIQFLSVTENIDTSTPFGKAILSIMGVIAELELETIKQRTQGGREKAIEAGTYVGNSPGFGYEKNVEKKLVILDEEAKYVRSIFDLYVNQKYSIGKIASYLKENNVPSPGASALIHNKRKGTLKKQNSTFHWSHPSVLKILKDEIYTGKYYYKKKENGKPVPKKDWKMSSYTNPPIVDTLTFYKAQELIEQSKHSKKDARRRKNPYVLSGLLKCDHCKDRRDEVGTYQHWVATPKKIKSTGNFTYYYTCGRKNRKKYEKSCSVLPLPATGIEEYIISYCLQLLKSPLSVFEHQKKLQSEKATQKHLQNKIEELNKLIAGLPSRRNHILEQHEHGYINEDNLHGKLDDIKKSEILYKKELIDVEKQFAQNTLSGNYLASLELFSKKYWNALSALKKDPKEVYNILHMLIDEIIVYSRPVTKNDVIAGRKNEDQQIPHRLHIKLKLPQTILNELAKEQNPIIEKTSLEDVSSSQKYDSGRSDRT